MAVGDIVNGKAVGVMTFQPAVGVEVMITSYMESTGGPAALWNGTSGANYSAAQGNRQSEMKMMIDNTNYFYSAGAGALETGYCGIVLKE